MPSARGSLRAVLAATVVSGLLILLAACSAPFDPTRPCPLEGRAPGAYPELEALVPSAFDSRPPAQLDSGRSCSPGALGSLLGHGIDELHFAGGIWPTSDSSGISFAVLEADLLQPGWVAEFYETGARAGRNVDEVASAPYSNGARVDALNRESFQTVIVMPREANRVSVVIVASFIREIQTRQAHEEVVQAALRSLLPGCCG